MKKLLLLTNSVFLCFILAFGSNLQQPQIKETKPIILEKAKAHDTTKVSKQTFVSGTIGTDQKTKKNVTNKTYKPRAIIHNDPEQGKIDSIKNAKTKIKNNSKGGQTNKDSKR